ncbi:MAG: hypothetical protein K2L89_04750 [Muribaculaceae bacterium]|nr:hypothetical protein [Muribaculaceae bacterium]
MKGIQLIYNKSDLSPIHISLPYSKSMAARALIMAALAGVRPENIRNLPVCTDTEELTAAIEILLDCIPSPEHRIKKGCSEKLCLSLNLGLGGTSLRFFTALAASIPDVEFEIDCAPPLKKRPLAPLCEALNVAGAEIAYLDNPGYPPLFIKGKHIFGGEKEISSAISSQFVSAMIMCAPYWQKGLCLRLTGEHPVSLPYIEMTTGMMSRAGAHVTFDKENLSITVADIPYSPSLISALAPETDWSAASYFYELALLLPEREITLSTLTPPPSYIAPPSPLSPPSSGSLQGDSKCCEIFALFGVETEYHPDGSATLRCDRTVRDRMSEFSKECPIELDMSDTPDLVPAIAVALSLADIRFRISGIGHLRHKESDRIAALEIELSKIGYDLDTDEDSMEWNGARTPVGENETIETYHDHRIAMAFAPAAVKLPYLSILDPKVTEKSFPDYFNILARIGFTIKPFG